MNVIFLDNFLEKFYKKSLPCSYQVLDDICSNTIKMIESRNSLTFIFFNLDNSNSVSILKKINNIETENIYKIGISSNNIFNINIFKLNLDHIQSLSYLQIDLNKISVKNNLKKYFPINRNISFYSISNIKKYNKDEIIIDTHIKDVQNKNYNFSIYNGLLKKHSNDKFNFNSESKKLTNIFYNSNIISFNKEDIETNLLTKDALINNKKILIYSNSEFNTELPFLKIKIAKTAEDFLTNLKTEKYDFFIFEFTNQNETLQKNLVWKILETNKTIEGCFLKSKKHYYPEYTHIEFYQKNIINFIKKDLSVKFKKDKIINPLLKNNFILIKDILKISNINKKEIMGESTSFFYKKNGLFLINYPFKCFLKLKNIKYLNNKYYYCFEILESDLPEKIKLSSYIESL